MTAKTVRKDTLVEGVDWNGYWRRRDGCEVSPSCLDCPLPECNLVPPKEERAKIRQRRNEMIWRWRTVAGLSAATIASALHTSTRTVFRVLQAGPPENRPSGERETAQPSSEAAASGHRPIYSERAPLQPLRPGYSSSRVVYERC